MATLYNLARIVEHISHLNIYPILGTQQTYFGLAKCAKREYDCIYALMHIYMYMHIHQYQYTGCPGDPPQGPPKIHQRPSRGLNLYSGRWQTDY